MGKQKEKYLSMVRAEGVTDDTEAELVVRAAQQRADAQAKGVKA